MKYPSVCIIIDILVIFIIFSLADDSSNLDIKKIYAKTIEDVSKPSQNPDNEENQKLKTNTSITKLSGSELDKFTSEHFAIVHGEDCPVPSCGTIDLRERRKRAPLLSPVLAKLAGIVYMINRSIQNRPINGSAPNMRGEGLFLI